MPRGREVASFNIGATGIAVEKPVGFDNKFFRQLCGITPLWKRGMRGI